MKSIVAVAAVASICGIALAVECWLDRHHVSDWVQNAFLGVVGLAIAALMAAVAFHFGRFA